MVLHDLTRMDWVTFVLMCCPYVGQDLLDACCKIVFAGDSSLKAGERQKWIHGESFQGISFTARDL